MNYQVTLFHKGRAVWRNEIETSSPKQAAHEAYTNFMNSFSHALVVGKKSVKRFDSNFKLIKAEPALFKAYFRGHPAVMIHFGKTIEFYCFENPKQRDEIYEELCTLSTPAESVNLDKAQTDITASLEETSATKSGLMFPKILNGFATNVTWTARLIQESIDKPSGIVKSKSTATAEWSSGSKASHSKRSPIFATVKNVRRTSEFPTFNEHMKKMIGKTIEVVPFKFGGKTVWKMTSGKNWNFLEKWLDFNSVTLMVKNLPEGTVHTLSSGVQEQFSHPELCGKTKAFLRCGCGCGMYQTDTSGYYAKEWLQLPDQPLETLEHKTIAKVLKPNLDDNHRDPETKIYWSTYMDKYIGNIYEFQKEQGGSFSLMDEGKMWYFAPAWLDFNVVKKGLPAVYKQTPKKYYETGVA